MIRILKKEHIAAQDAEISYSPQSQNLTRIVVGQVLIKKLYRGPSQKLEILVHARNISEYCKENNLKTFTPQASNKWCDKITAISPAEWVDYLYSCKYVFTSSFHGSIFSIKFKKKFIYFKDYWSFNKVYNILEYLGLQQNLFLDKNTFGILKNENFFNEDFNLKINSLLKNSNNFLEKI